MFKILNFIFPYIFTFTAILTICGCYVFSLNIFTHISHTICLKQCIHKYKHNFNTQKIAWLPFSFTTENLGVVSPRETIFNDYRSKFSISKSRLFPVHSDSLPQNITRSTVIRLPVFTLEVHRKWKCFVRIRSKCSLLQLIRIWEFRSKREEMKFQYANLGNGVIFK